MEGSQTLIPGTRTFAPAPHYDQRDEFYEAFTRHSLKHAVGHALAVNGGSDSISPRGSIRGLHFADAASRPGSFVQCHTGRLIDVVAGTRDGSPSLDQREEAELTSDFRQQLYLTKRLGQALCALGERVTMGCRCSKPYAPECEHRSHSPDPSLGIARRQESDIHLGTEDAAAPSIAEVLTLGVLPTHTQCVQQFAELGSQ